MAGKAALIGAIASLAPVDLHTNLREGCLEDQQNLSALPFLGQGKLMLIQSFLVSNTLWCGFAVEAHTILIGAEALQLPARGYANLGPLTTITSVTALEVPLHHVVTAMTTQILPLRLHSRLCLHRQSHQPQQCQKKSPSHI